MTTIRDAIGAQYHIHCINMRIAMTTALPILPNCLIEIALEYAQLPNKEAHFERVVELHSGGIEARTRSDSGIGLGIGIHVLIGYDRHVRIVIHNSYGVRTFDTTAAGAGRIQDMTIADDEHWNNCIFNRLAAGYGIGPRHDRIPAIAMTAIHLVAELPIAYAAAASGLGA
jgi:hypothetical protein